MEYLECDWLFFSLEAIDLDGLDLRIVRLECNCHMSSGRQNAYIFDDLRAFYLKKAVQ